MSSRSQRYVFPQRLLYLALVQQALPWFVFLLLLQLSLGILLMFAVVCLAMFLGLSVVAVDMLRLSRGVFESDMTTFTWLTEICTWGIERWGKVLFTDLRLVLWLVLAETLILDRKSKGGLIYILPVVLLSFGIIIVIALAEHTIPTAFERDLKNCSMAQRLRCYAEIFSSSRPLEIAWRFSTAVLRVLPKVQIVGEMRCGTTTLASLLADLPGARGPFSPFLQDNLNNKESLYHVGVYWGIVHPFLYRMCFPTIFEELVWNIAGCPLFVYDASAANASTPWAPSFLKKATPEAKIIFCTRDPVDQNCSFWRFYSAAQNYCDLHLPGTQRIHGPLPTSLLEAFAHVASENSDALFQQNELMVSWRLPMSAVMGGGGTLASLARMGRFADNIARWSNAFDDVLVIDLEETSDGRIFTLLANLVCRIQPNSIAAKFAMSKACQREFAPVLNSCPGETASHAEVHAMAQFYARYNHQLPGLASGGERKWLLKAMYAEKASHGES